MSTFSSLGLSEELCGAVERIGWKTPTKIQAECIPKALKGEDVAGMAETGSGKTGAFVLPMLQRFYEAGKPRLFAIIVAPTHELVIQISDVIKSLLNDESILIANVYGGVSEVEQMLELSKNPHIIVVTPGRIAHFINNAKGFSISNVKIVIIDEADKMSSIAFFEDIRAVVGKASNRKQLLLFSATLPSNAESLASLSVQMEALVKVHSRQAKPAKLIDEMVAIKPGDKERTLVALLNERPEDRFILFTATVRTAQILFDFLRIMGFSVGRAHGGVDQGEREETFEAFKNGTIKLLVSTNVAARGVDFPNVDVVINYDLPEKAREYTHRIGRAGRANREGHAYTFVTKEDMRQFFAIESSLKRRIEAREVNLDTVAPLTKKIEEAKEEAVELFKKASRAK